MTETIESLPFYNELALGAAPPKGWQMTIRWYCHVSKDALLLDVGGQVFHLRRQKTYEKFFNIIGELREADKLTDGLVEKIISDDGGRSKDDEDAVPADDQWLSLPVCAEIVVHQVTKTFHVRYRDEWDMLTSDQREIESERNATLHGVPSPVVSLCLGADALMAMHKFSTVLRAVAKLRDLPFENRAQAISILREKLSTSGIDSSLMGSAQWSFPDNDWNSPENTHGFAFAHIAHPNARWTFLQRRVIVFGVEGPKEKMYYLGVTQLGALDDDTVSLYNEGTRNSLASKRAATERAENSREFVQNNWPLFSAPPPGPILFPKDPDMAKKYILGLTRFAQQRGSDPTLAGKLHNKGCVCPWITEDVSQLVCCWCGQDKYNGKKQFCDHINGQKHQKKCEAEAQALTHEALTTAVHAVYQQSLVEQDQDRQVGDGAENSSDRCPGEQHSGYKSWDGYSPGKGSSYVSKQWSPWSGGWYWSGHDGNSASNDGSAWSNWSWQHWDDADQWWERWNSDKWWSSGGSWWQSGW